VAADEAARPARALVAALEVPKAAEEGEAKIAKKGDE